MSENAINFSSPYYEKGFWFEPKRIEPEDADIWGNRGFLKKYWGEGSSSSIDLSGDSLYRFDNYYSADYGGYEQKAAQDGFSYDNVFNSFREKIDKIGEQNSSSSSATPNYCGYFDAYFN